MFTEAELIEIETRAEILLDPRESRPYFHSKEPVTLDQLELLVLQDIRRLIACVRKRNSMAVLVRGASS
jgi:hypothetical protein